MSPCGGGSVTFDAKSVTFAHRPVDGVRRQALEEQRLLLSDTAASVTLHARRAAVRDATAASPSAHRLCHTTRRVGKRSAQGRGLPPQASAKALIGKPAELGLSERCNSAQFDLPPHPLGLSVLSLSKGEALTKGPRQHPSTSSR